MNTRYPHIALRLLLPLIVAVSSGCAWRGQNYPDAAVGTEVVQTATQMVGVPYRYGGRSPGGFDCSGLVWYSYRQAGLNVPRTSKDQWHQSQAIELRDARPGDLLFFSEGRNVSHVAIYLGSNRFVHAPSSGRSVSITNLSSPWYRDHFVTAGRLY